MNRWPKTKENRELQKMVHRDFHTNYILRLSYKIAINALNKAISAYQTYNKMSKWKDFTKKNHSDFQMSAF